MTSVYIILLLCITSITAVCGKKEASDEVDSPLLSPSSVSSPPQDDCFNNMLGSPVPSSEALTGSDENRTPFERQNSQATVMSGPSFGSPGSMHIPSDDRLPEVPTTPCLQSPPQSSKVLAVSTDSPSIPINVLPATPVTSAPTGRNPLSDVSNIACRGTMLCVPGSTDQIVPAVADIPCDSRSGRGILRQSISAHGEKPFSAAQSGVNPSHSSDALTFQAAQMADTNDDEIPPALGDIGRSRSAFWFEGSSESIDVGNEESPTRITEYMPSSSCLDVTRTKRRGGFSLSDTPPLTPQPPQDERQSPTDAASPLRLTRSMVPLPPSGTSSNPFLRGPTPSQITVVPINSVDSFAHRTNADNTEGSTKVLSRQPSSLVSRKSTLDFTGIQSTYNFLDESTRLEALRKLGHVGGTMITGLHLGPRSGVVAEDLLEVLPQFTALKELTLMGLGFDDRIVPVVCGLSRLQMLNLQHNNLSLQGFYKLIRGSLVQELSIAENDLFGHLGNQSVDLSDFEKFHNMSLKFLNASNLPIVVYTKNRWPSDYSSPFLRMLGRCSGLSTVMFVNTGLNEVAYHPLERLLGCRHIQRLDIRDNNVHPVYLAQLMQGNQLQELKFGSQEEPTTLTKPKPKYRRDAKKPWNKFIAQNPVPDAWINRRS